LGEGQLIRKLKLGGVNHDRMGKNCVGARKHISQGNLPDTKGGRYHLKSTSKIWPTLTEAYFKIIK
jgi:hypothetical protein